MALNWKENSDTVVEALSQFAVQLHPKQIPPEIKERVRLILLDAIGVGLAGTDTPVVTVAKRAADAFIGGRHSRVLGLSTQTSVLGAALANGLLLMATDYEPVGPEGHVCAAVIPTVLSLMDSEQKSGSEVLAALTAGLEVGGRVGAAMRRFPHSGVEIGARGNSHVIFGAAAAAGRLMGLSADEMAHALAIAGYSAMPPTLKKAMAGPRVPVIKYDNLPIAAEMGVQSAMLAKCGATGDLTVLDGPIGFWRFTSHLGYEQESVTADLGTSWIIPQVWHKRYPGSLFVATAVDAALQAQAESNADVAAIEQVVVKLRQNPTPVQRQAKAVTWGDVGLSLAYNIAMALLNIRPRRRWHSYEIAYQHSVQHLASRVEITSVANEEAPGPPWEGWSPAEVNVKAGGNWFGARKERLPILTEEEVIDKFRDNTNGILSQPITDRIVSTCLSLEELDLAADILDLLALS